MKRPVQPDPQHIRVTMITGAFPAVNGHSVPSVR